MIDANPPSLILFFFVLFAAQAILFPLLSAEVNALTVVAGTH